VPDAGAFATYSPSVLEFVLQFLDAHNLCEERRLDIGEFNIRGIILGLEASDRICSVTRPVFENIALDLNDREICRKVADICFNRVTAFSSGFPPFASASSFACRRIAIYLRYRFSAIHELQNPSTTLMRLIFSQHSLIVLQWASLCLASIKMNWLDYTLHPCANPPDASIPILRAIQRICDGPDETENENEHPEKWKF
jgi:hypothetical protein